MSSHLNVACLQNCAGTDVSQNLLDLRVMIDQARTAGADLVCLPEYGTCLGVDGAEFIVGANEEESHPALAFMSDVAKETGVWILIGSMAVNAPGGKIVNRSLLINDLGEVVSRYDKIHLFDVDLANGETYRESATIQPGDRAVVADTPWGGIGLTVCYDVRFPQLYRSLARGGAGIITVPAAFARTTGEAHWHVLLRSRAIETGCFIIAPCQTGLHGTSESYGHSLVIDPWGKVLADAGRDPGIITATLDLSLIEKCRGMVPALKHDRPYLEVEAGRRSQAAE
jgi:deaminated glutathione amidase